MAKATFMMSKHIEIKDNVREYFSNFKFESQFELLHNLPLNLHWADSRILIEKVKQKLKYGEELFYNEKQFATEVIQSLKKVPIWLKNGDYVIPMTIFDVYSSLGQYIKKEAMEDELFNSQEISFIAPTGPFKQMPMINCINEQTLNIFIHWMVMTNKLPQRDFRIITKGHVATEFKQGIEKNMNLLKVDQITDSGILLSSKNELLLDTMEKAEELKVFFNTEKIFKAVQSDTQNRNEDFFFSNDKLHYFKIKQKKIIKKLKYNSHHSGEFFLFCRYFDMTESEVPELMKKFTGDTKKIILDSVA